ncbi:MAG: hypothetical protein DI629_07765 [Mesorhizobium amorphae]|nr:MAG: hypothetical protein DI629_07765 [Mesorhizobium amorphae]
MRASLGLLVWAVGFSVIYAVHGYGCEAGWALRPLGGLSLFRWALYAAWALSLAAGALVVWWSFRRRESAVLGAFEARLARISALVGFVALVVTGAPSAVFSACV